MYWRRLIRREARALECEREGVTMDDRTGPAPIPLLDLKAQYATIREEVRPVIDAVCESQRFIGGPEVVECEKEVAAYCGCRFGVGTTSGTDALLCGMMAMGIGAGDEVIVPAFTFFATAGCVWRLGAKPVFVDVDPETFNATADFVARAITPRTRLIIPVHLFGQCADMDSILEAARPRSIPVMEDSAQSIGATYHGRKSCSLGRLAALSFFPSKNLGAFGDAGMIVSNDEELAARCRMFRDHGASPKYYHKFIGGNFRLDALQAAILRVKLRHLDAWSAKRAKNAAFYSKLFAGSPVRTPKIAPGNVSIYNQYVIRVPHRDALRDHLTKAGIGTEVYYPVPLHLQECFAPLGGKPGDLPNAEQAAREVLALPIYPELTEAQQERVAAVILEFLRARR
jgi:dTDP-4-amino-4,6-dideoxygalactose transaminase